MTWPNYVWPTINYGSDGKCKITNTFHFTKKRNTKNTPYRGKTQTLAKEPRGWAGLPQIKQWQIEPERCVAAEAGKATQKCSEEQCKTHICTALSPPSPALLQGAVGAEVAAVGMAEELGTTWCCTCGRTDATSCSASLVTAPQWRSSETCWCWRHRGGTVAAACRIAISLSRAPPSLRRHENTWLMDLQFSWHIWLSAHPQSKKSCVSQLIRSAVHDVHICRVVTSFPWRPFADIYQGWTHPESQTSLKNGHNPLRQHFLAK